MVSGVERTSMYNDKKYLTKKNVFGFAGGGFGQNLIIGTVNSYLLYFYTDIFRIGYLATTVLMMTARIFDALNDPVMGTIVDKTHTKIGKLRPYLAATPLPLMILTIAVFCTPELSQAGKIAYASVTYILWGLTYTVCDIPFWGLPAVMTPNPDERVKFITFSRLFHGIGGALPMLTLPIAEIFLGSKTENAYLAIAIFAGVVGAGLFSTAFFFSKERVVQDGPHPTVKQTFGYLFKNKPLRTVVLANILGFARAIAISAGMYIATYLAPDAPDFLPTSMINTLIAAGWGVAGFVGMLFTPALLRKTDYRKIYLICCAAGIGAMALMIILGFTVGYSVYMFVIIFTIMGLPYGIVCNLNYAMISESIDYIEWKEGRRTEGISVSMQTLMNKMMTALQTTVIPLFLMLVGFIEPTDANPEPLQEESAITGLFVMVSVLPAVGWILNALLISRYTLIGEERKRMYEELAARHNAEESVAE